MNVTKCDSCGKIVGNNEAFKVDVTSLKPKGNKVSRVCKLEVCSDCKDKVLEILNVKEDKDEGENNPFC